jgi:hypothetical protein
MHKHKYVLTKTQQLNIHLDKIMHVPVQNILFPLGACQTPPQKTELPVTSFIWQNFLADRVGCMWFETSYAGYVCFHCIWMAGSYTRQGGLRHSASGGNIT